MRDETQLPFPKTQLSFIVENHTKLLGAKPRVISGAEPHAEMGDEVLTLRCFKNPNRDVITILRITMEKCDPNLWPDIRWFCGDYSHASYIS